MTRSAVRHVQTARGRRFAVVSGHDLATQIAVVVLENGGNPIDAAIAGAAALTVILPHACTLGGDCFALVHSGGKTYGVNGSGRSPEGLPSDVRADALAQGPLSCSVPGIVGAWEALHECFGSRPWSSLLMPAVELARNGIPIGRGLSAASRANLARLFQDPGCRTVFLKDGEPLVEGNELKQPAVAEALATIAAAGARSFYQGSLGRHLCRAVSELGGVLSPADLEAYRPLWVEPLSVDYRGITLRAMPPNSYGLAMLMQFAALASVDLRTHPLGSVERLANLMRAARAAFALAAPYIADPELVANRLDEALGPATVEWLRQTLCQPDGRAQEAIRSQGTSVISIADGTGTGITLIQSIFAPFGSLVADCETGIVLNNRLLGFSRVAGHPNAPGPGKRPAHTLNPAMAFDGDRLAFLLGTPGGSGQTITLAQVVSAVLDLGIDLDEAIAAPRWSMDLNGDFALEPEMPPDMPELLGKRGIEARFATDQQRFFFGSAECIEVREDGVLFAVADDRREASAAAR